MLISGGRIMCKAAEVGKIVVNKCIDLKLSIDVQKLQKLLVLMQIECIKRSGKPLFKEDILIWDCGVAIKEVDEEFRSTGATVANRQVEYINLLDHENKSVDAILRLYGSMSAIELNDLPVNKKIQNLAIHSPNSGVPHAKYEMLVKEFKQNESN